MADEWQTVPVTEIKVGDQVRHRGFEFPVGRVDEGFLGREGMLCLIEDTPERWHAYPAPVTAEVEVRR